jgi:hypothetical protein
MGSGVLKHNTPPAGGKGAASGELLSLNGRKRMAKGEKGKTAISRKL